MKLIHEVGLHDIGKLWDCDILFCCDIYIYIYSDMNTMSPDSLNSSLLERIRSFRLIGIILEDYRDYSGLFLGRKIFFYQIIQVQK